MQFFRLTNHLRERFIQRTNKKYTHIQLCKQSICKTCEDLKKEIQVEISYNKKDIDRNILRRIQNAETDRSYTNNTEFMLNLYERHGYEERFEFFVHEDLVFVVIFRNGEKVVVTCVSSKTHIVGKNYHSRNHFKKKSNVLHS